MVLPVSLACGGFHHHTHLFERSDAGFGQGRGDGGFDFGFGSGGRQIGFDEHALGLFLAGLLGAAGLAEHLGGIDALLDEGLQHLHFGRFVQRLGRIHLLLHERGLDHAERAEARLFAALHGRDHILLHLVDERHVVCYSRTPRSGEAGKSRRGARTGAQFHSFRYGSRLERAASGYFGACWVAYLQKRFGCNIVPGLSGAQRFWDAGARIGQRTALRRLSFISRSFFLVVVSGWFFSSDLLAWVRHQVAQALTSPGAEWETAGLPAMGTRWRILRWSLRGLKKPRRERLSLPWPKRSRTYSPLKMKARTRPRSSPAAVSL